MTKVNTTSNEGNNLIIPTIFSQKNIEHDLKTGFVCNSGYYELPVDSQIWTHLSTQTVNS